MKGHAKMHAAFHHAKIGVKVTHSKDGKTTGTFQPRNWPAFGSPPVVGGGPKQREHSPRPGAGGRVPNPPLPGRAGKR